MLPGSPKSRSDGTPRDSETLAYATPLKPMRNRMLTLLVMIAASGVLLVWAGAFVHVGVAEWRAMRDRVRQQRVSGLQAQPSTSQTMSVVAESGGAATTPTDVPQTGR